MAITVERLIEAYNKYKVKYEGRKEDYFAPLFISDKFDRPVDSVLDQCAYGNNDYGIDAYHIEKDAKNLYLYQFKWSDNYELFKETYKRLIRDGIEKIFADTYQDTNSNEVIKKLKYDLQEFKDLINKVYISSIQKFSATNYKK